MNITYQLTMVLLCFVLLDTTCEQSGNAAARIRAATRKEKDPQPLKLAIDIVGQKYCTGDAELDGLQINVRFTYTNISNRRVIVYKSANLISRIMIGKTLADIEASRFQVDSSLTQLIAGGKNCLKGPVPSRCFVVLLPGASYQVRADIGVFAVRDDSREIAGAVRSGEHVLQVEVSTWPDSKASVGEMRHRWRRSGLLWYDPVTSAPRPFTVERERKVVDCP
jgi:hypothetical protein